MASGTEMCASGAKEMKGGEPSDLEQKSIRTGLPFQRECRQVNASTCWGYLLCPLSLTFFLPDMQNADESKQAAGVH